MNFKDIKFDYMDDFGEEKIFYFNVGIVENKFVEIAKKKDEEAYNEQCFRYGIFYNKKVYEHGTLEYISQDDGLIEIKQLNKEEIEEFKNCLINFMKEKCIDVDVQCIGENEFTTKEEILKWYETKSEEAIIKIYEEYYGWKSLENIKKD